MPDIGRSISCFVVLVVLVASHGCDSIPPRMPTWTGPDLIGVPATRPMVGLGADAPSDLEVVGDETPRIVTMDGGVTAVIDGGLVTVPGWIELEEGWLEVGVCRQGTREHETVVATTSLPSVVHAAMLLAGFEPGSPAWYRADGSSGPATGDAVLVEIRIDDEKESQRVIPLAEAVDDERGASDLHWVFAGSSFHPNPPAMGPGEYYAADYAGTIVGLTTFGDEVVAAVEVRSPEIGIDPAVWTIRKGVLPPAGSRVTLVLRRPSNE
ncbi:MAG: hypothetical protein GY895_04375 [Phycisphaera sp.]|nr:hypothetical protein [Phycisphaera sp.]